MDSAIDMNTTQPELDVNTELAISTSALNLWYGTFQALFDVNLEIVSYRR